jgi:hypothetical protein
MSSEPESGPFIERARFRPFSLNRARTAFVVRLPEHAVVPQSCCNCGQPATVAQPEGLRGQNLLIPYCDECGVAAAGLGTLRLASTVASALLVTTLLLVLPGWFGRLGLLGSLVLLLVSGALPLLVAGGVRRGFGAPRTAAVRAVFWLRPNVLACFNPSWAAGLAQRDESELERVNVREPVLTPWMWSAVVLGVALLPKVHSYLMPSVVALNFGDSAVDIEFDSGQSVRVDPTSLESERAGSRVRLPAGTHTATLRSLEGQVLETRELRVQPGALHLLSVSGREHCFWLERDAYGQAGDAERRYDLLDPNRAFWVIDTRVDSLFAANPETSTDRASSGGIMTALRQGRCDALPPALGGPAARGSASDPVR